MVELSPEIAELMAAALAARDRAYAPYSRFRVGAAVRSADGRVHAGCNVENAAYPVGTCAEAGAIAAMVAAGGTRLASILIVGDGAEPVAPCGACRQRIAEFAGPDTRIHCASPSGIGFTMTVATMLPAAFGPAALADASADPKPRSGTERRDDTEPRHAGT